MKILNLKRAVVTVLFAALLAVGLAPRSEAVLDKTRFAARVGVAYFCYHHWVSNPYREGKFVPNAPHRTASIVKAGAALLFAVHELKIAYKIAHESKDPLLQRLAGSVDNMSSNFDIIGHRFKQGKFANDDIGLLTSAYTGMESSARAAKVDVKDVPVTVPGG